MDAAFKTTAVLAIVVAAVAVLLFVFVPVLFYLGLIGAVIYFAWHYTRPRCPSCGRYGTVSSSGSEVVDTETGYGLVTRHDTTTTSRRDDEGNLVKEKSVTSRQERAPVVRKTVRTTYRCRECGHSYSRDSVTEEEDFADRPTKEKETVVIQKEVVKVPCKYCGALNDIVAQKTCSNCGAAIKP